MFQHALVTFLVTFFAPPTLPSSATTDDVIAVRTKHSRTLVRSIHTIPLRLFAEVSFGLDEESGFPQIPTGLNFVKVTQSTGDKPRGDRDEHAHEEQEYDCIHLILPATSSLA